MVFANKQIITTRIVYRCGFLKQERQGLYIKKDFLIVPERSGVYFERLKTGRLKYILIV